MTASLEKAKIEHNRFLQKRGLLPSQIAKKRKGWKSANLEIHTPGYVYNSRRPKTSDTVGNGFSKSILDNLHLEPEHVREEILKKAMRVESLYSKGPTQYITDGTDTTMLGSRSRRG
jgi:hypothetical protein